MDHRAEHRDDEFEEDSELGDDLDIDEAGNVVKHNVGGFNASDVAHILAGYGTDICEQLIGEFVKLEVNNKNLSALCDKDLEMLGIKDPKVRAQMLEEFMQLPHQSDHYSKAKLETDNNQYNDVVLTNIYKHLNDLKSSLSVILLRLYVKPSENILINQNTYASAIVLKTLDEFNRNVNVMERKLLELQYGKKQVPARSNRLWRWMIAIGMISVGSAILIKYYRPSFVR